ncbi:MAG TPA: hypothetical protein PKY81_09155 [bacterium]|nr:hypothetical protein [bacterium]
MSAERNNISDDNNKRTNEIITNIKSEIDNLIYEFLFAEKNYTALIEFEKKKNIKESIANIISKIKNNLGPDSDEIFNAAWKLYLHSCNTVANSFFKSVLFSKLQFLMPEFSKDEQLLFNLLFNKNFMNFSYNTNVFEAKLLLLTLKRDNELCSEFINCIHAYSNEINENNQANLEKTLRKLKATIYFLIKKQEEIKDKKKIDNNEFNFDSKVFESLTESIKFEINDNKYIDPLSFLEKIKNEALLKNNDEKQKEVIKLLSTGIKKHVILKKLDIDDNEYRRLFRNLSYALNSFIEKKVKEIDKYSQINTIELFDYLYKALLGIGWSAQFRNFITKHYSGELKRIENY